MREEKLLNLRCGQRDRAPDGLFSLPASIWRCARWRFAALEGQRLVMSCDGSLASSCTLDFDPSAAALAERVQIQRVIVNLICIAWKRWPVRSTANL